MTQIEQDRRQALTGRAYCSGCRSTMLRMGPDYICPSRVNPSLRSCTDNSIDASRLLRLVATNIVNTVMIQPTVGKITERIQKESQETSKRFQDHLDQTEGALADLHKREATALSRPGQMDQDELKDISNRRAALSHEARVARRELDAQAFISDEKRIEANAKDVDTFLDEAPTEHTTEFIDNFVESVGVGPWSIDLNYKFPIPSQEHPEGKITHMIPRRGSDQTGVVGQDPQEPPETPATRLPSGRTSGNP